MTYHRILVRDCGKKVRISVTNFARAGFDPQPQTDVFTQNADGVNWDLLTQSLEDRAAAMAMSVDEYVKHGRHPIFYNVTFAELVRTSEEAKRCDWRNPDMDATVHFILDDGRELTMPVMVDTGNGIFDGAAALDEARAQADTDCVPAEVYAQIGSLRLAVETNEFQQYRVVDLSILQSLAARQLLSPAQKSAALSPGRR